MNQLDEVFSNEPIPCWTLDEALSLIRKLDVSLREIGAVSGLTGSVLFKGQSQKDLDIIIYPYNGAKSYSNEDLIRVLHSFEWVSKLDQTMLEQYDLDDTKQIEIWETSEGKRIDLFLLR